jgi:hypothetical protein
LIEQALENARNRAEGDLNPERETLALTRQALEKNHGAIEAMVNAISSGEAQGALWGLLNEKATQLKAERDGLMREQWRLMERVGALKTDFDASGLRGILSNFRRLAENAEPEELQRLLRLTVRRVEWTPDTGHKVQYFHLPKAENNTRKPDCLPGKDAGGQWFQTNIHNSSP